VRNSTLFISALSVARPTLLTGSHALAASAFVCVRPRRRFSLPITDVMQPDGFTTTLRWPDHRGHIHITPVIEQNEKRGAYRAHLASIQRAVAHQRRTEHRNLTWTANAGWPFSIYSPVIVHQCMHLSHGIPYIVPQCHPRTTCLFCVLFCLARSLTWTWSCKSAILCCCSKRPSSIDCLYLAPGLRTPPENDLFLGQNLDFLLCDFQLCVSSKSSMSAADGAARWPQLQHDKSSKNFRVCCTT
jgi:hypothetical protein